MALTLQAAVDLSRDPAFRDRVKAGMVRAAIAISADAVTDAEKQQRVGFAAQVARNPERFLDAFCLAVAASDATASATLTDATLYANLSGVWDTLAITTPALDS